MIGRPLFLLPCLLGLALIPQRLQAQAAPTATGPGTSVRVGGGVSLYQIEYGHQVLGGTHAWIDTSPYWRYGFEGEARWLRLHDEANTRQSTFLVGPRLALSPHRIQPYVKVLAGAGHMDFPFGYAHGTYFVVAAGGGVDFRLNQRLLVRAFDVEYQDWPQFSFGALQPYGVSFGVSYTVFRGSTSPHAR